VTRRDRLELPGIGLFGTFLHLGMDFLNSCGVRRNPLVRQLLPIITAKLINLALAKL
jgi:hypothetical protein